MYYVNHIIGGFIVDQNGNIVQELIRQESETPESILNRILVLKPQSKPLPPVLIQPFLANLITKPYHQALYTTNTRQTKIDLKKSINEDAFILQTIGSIGELDRSINLLAKRLREWQSIYFPELDHRIQDHRHFAELSLRPKEDVAKELSIPSEIGADLNIEHRIQIHHLATQIINLFNLREENEQYLHSVMKTYAPNILELAGTTIGARLIEYARGLKSLALLPASTIQLFGAEKALFRHIKTGAKSPKYGIIINHPLVQNAKREDKGKAARILADKLSLCARLDYFKGEFKAPQYKQELEGKLQ